MKEYFIAVITVSLLGGVIVSMLPDGNTAKNVRFLCSLCTVACIAFPLISFFDNGFDSQTLMNVFEQSEQESEFYDEIYNKSLNGYELLNVQSRLKQDMIQALILDSDMFDVEISIDENNDVNYISSVRVYVYASGISMNPREVKEYISERLGCDCEIVYNIS